LQAAFQDIDANIIEAMVANPVNVIALAPPLIVTKKEIDEGVSIMDEALGVADAFVYN